MNRFVLLFMLISGTLWSQNNELSLEECYRSMMENYPLTKQVPIYEESSNLKLKNLQSGWLPNAELNAKATYQSDVMEVNISAMGSNFGFTSEKDQYLGTIDINQLVYDWGRIKAAKQLENADLEIQKQEIQVELNKLKEQINRFYFSILILNNNQELMELMLEDLENQEKMVASAVKNGTMLPSNLNTLKAEKLKVKQSVTEIINQRLAAVQILSEITGMELSSDVSLQLPDYDINGEVKLFRPEHQLFNLQIKKADISGDLVAKQNDPTIYSFAQMGYGKPGLNMAGNEFDSFYLVGLGLSWNIWDWNQTKRKKQLALVSKRMINTRKESFNKQMEVSIHNVQALIATMQSTIITDEEIIELREEVTSSAKSKLKNGVITSTDYVSELYSETKAKLNYETHKIQLLQAKVNYLYLKGEI